MPCFKAFSCSAWSEQQQLLFGPLTRLLYLWLAHHINECIFNWIWHRLLFHLSFGYFCQLVRMFEDNNILVRKNSCQIIVLLMDIRIASLQRLILARHMFGRRFNFLFAFC